MTKKKKNSDDLSWFVIGHLENYFNNIIYRIRPEQPAITSFIASTILSCSCFAISFHLRFVAVSFYRFWPNWMRVNKRACCCCCCLTCTLFLEIISLFSDIYVVQSLAKYKKKKSAEMTSILLVLLLRPIGRASSEHSCITSSYGSNRMNDANHHKTAK